MTLSAGGTSLSVRTIDPAGNTTAGTSHSYTLDQTAPTAVATVTALSSDTGSSGSDFITSTASQTVSGTYTGTLGSGELIQVSANGGSTWVTAGTVDTVNHIWSASGVTLSAGGTSLSVRTIDPAGNATAGTSHSYTLDAAAPAAPSTPDMTPTSDSGDPTDNNTNIASATFTGTAEAGSTVTIFSDGVAVGSGVATGGNYYDHDLGAGERAAQHHGKGDRYRRQHQRGLGGAVGGDRHLGAGRNIGDHLHCRQHITN